MKKLQKTDNRTYPYYKGQYYDKVSLAWVDIQKSFATKNSAKDFMFKQRSLGAFKDYNCGVRVVKISKKDRSFYTAA